METENNQFKYLILAIVALAVVVWYAFFSFLMPELLKKKEYKVPEYKFETETDEYTNSDDIDYGYQKNEIGAKLYYAKSGFYVDDFWQDSTGEKAGLQFNDFITSVDGTLIDSVSNEEAALKLFSGEKGKIIKLKVERLVGDDYQMIDIDVVRGTKN